MSLGAKLNRAGFRTTSLQGNLSQGRRQAALDGFRSGEFQILVATDIAARGIDVSNVSHVINYDVPATADAYIHRIGRTGRAECSGDAFTLVTDEDSQMVKAINAAVGTSVERRILDDFNYGSPCSVSPAGAVKDRSTRPPAPKRQPPPAPKSRGRANKGAFAWLSPRKTKRFGTASKAY
jgi:ATP-dependent RNA helicase RhlE